MEIIKIDNSTSEKILVMGAYFGKEETQDAFMELIERMWCIWEKSKKEVNNESI